MQKKIFFFLDKVKILRLGRFITEKKYSSTPSNHSLCAGSGRVFISCDLGFEQNTVLGLAKHTIT